MAITTLNLNQIFVDEEDAIALLTKSTWEGKWNIVVEIFEHFPWTHTKAIGESSVGTALHVAVDSGREDNVEQLVKLILNHEAQGKSLQQQQIQPHFGASERETAILGSEEIQKELEKRAEAKALEIQNENGDMPLHLAASKGFWKICKCVIESNLSEVKNGMAGSESFAGKYLLRIKNKHGETPLFLAALNWHEQAFVYLNDIGGDSVLYPDLVRDNGDTILHCAIQSEYFDLAVIILKYYGHLLIGNVNENDFTPLTVLATKRSVFWSSSNLTWFDQILYHCLPVQQLDVESALKKIRGLSVIAAPHHPKNWVTCCEVINLLLSLGRFVIRIVFRNENEGDIEGGSGAVQPVCAAWRTCLEMVTLVFVSLTEGSNRIKIKKQKHLWGVQILKELMKEPCRSYFGDVVMRNADSQFPFFDPTPLDTGVQSRPERIKAQRMDEDLNKAPETDKKKETASSTDDKNETASSADEKKETTLLVPAENSVVEIVDAVKQLPVLPIQKMNREKNNVLLVAVPETVKETKLTEKTALLLAARNGIKEIVDEILRLLPVTIQEKNSENKNVLLVAVQNRQPLIVKALTTHPLWHNLLLGVDMKKNNILHLAANVLDPKKPWTIPGVAMQMTWDVKWYEYIKSLVPEHFHLRSNEDQQTPWEIFNESHEELVSKGSEWLKDTSESCSVVAALIAGVSFATSSTVPGGTDSETGKPALEGQPAFDLFAMTSLVSLCFSVTALIMFLSILTSRKQAKDFRRNLPLKLLLGLSSLFVSIASMFVSFCAGHFFVLRDKFKNTIFPIYAATCLPVSLYAVAQFPLYIDLLRSIVAKVPHPRDKGDDS